MNLYCNEGLILSRKGMGTSLKFEIYKQGFWGKKALENAAGNRPRFGPFKSSGPPDPANPPKYPISG